MGVSILLQGVIAAVCVRSIVKLRKNKCTYSSMLFVLVTAGMNPDNLVFFGGFDATSLVLLVGIVAIVRFSTEALVEACLETAFAFELSLTGSNLVLVVTSVSISLIVASASAVTGVSKLCIFVKSRYTEDGNVATAQVAPSATDSDGLHSQPVTNPNGHISRLPRAKSGTAFEEPSQPEASVAEQSSDPLGALQGRAVEGGIPQATTPQGPPQTTVTVNAPHSPEGESSAPPQNQDMRVSAPPGLPRWSLINS